MLYFVVPTTYVVAKIMGYSSNICDSENYHISYQNVLSGYECLLGCHCSSRLRESSDVFLPDFYQILLSVGYSQCVPSLRREVTGARWHTL